jgi:hypothetical protein
MYTGQQSTAAVCSVMESSTWVNIIQGEQGEHHPSWNGERDVDAITS